MKCERVKKLLVDYIEDALSRRKRQAIELHLSNCPLCSEEFLSIRRLRERLSSLEPPDRDSRFWENFNARLSGKLAQEEASVSRRPDWLPMRPLAAAAAVAIALAVSLVFSARLHERQIATNESGTPSASEEIDMSEWEVAVSDSYGDSEMRLALANLSAEEIGELDESLPTLADESKQTTSDEVALDRIYEQGMYDLLDELTSEECEELYSELDAI